MANNNSNYRLNKRELRSRGYRSQRRITLEARGALAADRFKKFRNQRIRQKSSFLIDNKGSIFSIVIMILLVISIFGVLANKELIDFGGFLSILRNAPTIDLGWLNLSSASIGDWGAFNFLKDFIYLILGALDVVSFIGTALLQVVLYIVYFLKVLLL